MSTYMQYNEAIERLLQIGDNIPSRHGPTVERLNFSATFYGNTFLVRKGMNTALGWMEAFQIIAGVFYPEDLKQVAPKAQHHLFTPQMAYGPRLGNQVDDVIKYLKKFPEGRQALIWIAKPEDGCTDAQTCTTSIQFLLRHKQLHGTVNMRSWDAVKGFPYDLMFFQLFKACIARALEVAPGNLTVNAGSFHLYEADISMAVGEADGDFQFNLGWPDTWPEMQLAALEQVGSYSKRGWPTCLVVSSWRGDSNGWK